MSWSSDWANARAGHWADDVAQTVIILAAADLSRATKLALRAFLAAHLAGFDHAVVREHLRRRSSAAWRIRI